MAWARVLWAIYLSLEDVIVQQILRIPAFHRGVRRIHRTVEDLRHGRDPSEPLRQGEATAEPNRAEGFLKHFIEELRNQARGRWDDVPPPPPKR
ncbi:hypothetical protein N656DRAFT_797621 [Canariomyces notabilis]|uniref:Uncharacterized protein n=1 Tax=Canariomyces notabilis TaxID=2074819 RepID=A0AAN6YTG4_9PEZI|nr:hypothetical protein N656DRAFT_797621 [Canariomyces arenarius]